MPNRNFRTTLILSALVAFAPMSIDLYGVPAHDYGWLFGLNAGGIIAFTQANRRLLLRYDADRVLDFGTAVPMAAVVATCGFLAFICYRLLMRRW